MRPWLHARSSARDARPWTDDLAVHEFMDITKFACADRRHRALLHHVDLGAAVVARAFPARPDTAALVTSHVTEDLGRPATLADWFALCRPDNLPKPVARRIVDGPDGVATMVAARHPEAALPAIRDVAAFLFSPPQFLPEAPERALPLFMNAAGPMLVRHVFGPPAPLNGDGPVIDYAYLAEAVIYTSFGAIPDLGQVVRCFTAEPIDPDKVRV